MSKQWTEEEVLKILAIVKSADVDSLNRLIGNEESPSELGELVLDERPGPQEIVEQTDRIKILQKAISYLKPREQMIIQMRYGLKDGQFRTLDECGDYFGVTRERIRQVEAKAMKRLKWIIKCKFKLKEGDL